MDKIEIAKKVAGFVVAAGVSKIIRGVIKNNAAPDGVIDQVTIAAASLALGGVVAGATRKYTDAKIDEIVKHWNDIFNPAEQEEIEE